jgi:hypothetical protein
MRKFTVDVTQTVEVELDETKFTPEFCKEYNESITYRGGDDGDMEWALREHAEHLAWLHASGVQDLEYHSLPPFIEGYGPANEMGIKAKVIDTEPEST